MEKLVPGNGRTFLSDFLGSFARVFHRRTVVPHRNTFPRPEYAGAESPRVVDQSRVNLLSRQFGKHESGSIATTICGRSIGTTDRKSTRLNSSHGSISYAVFCLKKKKEH